MNSSVLWIFLIVAWLFILLPMVLRGRPEVRKTTDAALNTRVVHRGGTSAPLRRAPRRRSPATPVLKRAEPEDVDDVDGTDVEDTEPIHKKAPVTLKSAAGADAKTDELRKDEPVKDESKKLDALSSEVPAGAAEAAAKKVAAVKAAARDAEVAAATTDVLDVVDDADAEEVTGAPTEQLPVVAAKPDPKDADSDDGDGIDPDVEAEDDFDDEAEDSYDDYDDLDDLDEVRPGRRRTESDDEPTVPTPRELRGRGRYTASAIAERDQIRYRGRQRNLLILIALTVAAGASCIVWQPYGFILFGALAAILGLYLFFLRRIAIGEQHYRAQRAARMRREEEQAQRMRDDHTGSGEAQQRLPFRRPGGMVVVDLDDEDPAFENLPTHAYAHAGSGRSDRQYQRAV